MRNEILRDVLAGSAGVLAVAAVIGLPRGAVTANVPAPFSGQHVVLLPHYTRTRPNVPPLTAQPRTTFGR
jgi:hypothetical protein